MHRRQRRRKTGRTFSLTSVNYDYLERRRERPASCRVRYFIACNNEPVGWGTGRDRSQQVSLLAGGGGSSGFRESKVDAQKLYENFNQLSIGNNIPSLDESESGRRCKSLEFLSIYINFQLDKNWNNQTI